MNGRERVSWNLRKARTARKLTQEQLAFESEVDRTYISGIERGTFNPTVDLLERLADALGLDISRLFEVPPSNEETPEPLKAGRKPK